MIEEITVDLDAKLLPQLVVLSAITNSPAGGGPFIGNHCCVIKDANELRAEIDRWRQDIEADNYSIVNIVARIVPPETYLPMAQKIMAK